MLVVVALGGKADDAVAAGAIAAVAHDHEVVVTHDRDLAAAALAERLGASALLLLTDVRAVVSAWGQPWAVDIRHVSPAELRHMDFPAASMGPKVEAACRFVEATGGRAAIGALRDAAWLLDGSRGTLIELEPEGVHV